jgi:hypothetical protein
LRVAFGFRGADVTAELGEAVTDGPTEGSGVFGAEVVVGVVLELIEQLGLPAPEVLDVRGELGSAGGRLAVGVWSVVIEVGVEEGAAVGSEDASGKEVVDGGGEGVFADPDALGVGGVTGLVGMVASVGLAGEVGVGPPGLAEHPPPAQVVDHVGAQQVGPFGLGWAFGGDAGAGARAMPEIRSIDSQTTAMNRRSGRCASASRSRARTSHYQQQATQQP